MMRAPCIPTCSPPSVELDPSLKLLLLQEALRALDGATALLEHEAQRQREEDLADGSS